MRPHLQPCCGAQFNGLQCGGVANATRYFLEPFCVTETRREQEPIAATIRDPKDVLVRWTEPRAHGDDNWPALKCVLATPL